MPRRPLLLATLLSALLAAGPALAQGAPPGMPGTSAIQSEDARLLPVFAPHGMVASQEAKATRIGVDVLNFQAAVVGFDWTARNVRGRLAVRTDIDRHINNRTRQACYEFSLAKRFCLPMQPSNDALFRFRHIVLNKPRNTIFKK